MGDPQISAVPLPLRWAVIGSVAAGVVGGIAGLIIGLQVYAPTAWFAVFEIGVPSAVLGGFIGLVTGLIASAIHRRARP